MTMSDLSPSLKAHPLASQWMQFLSDSSVLIMSGKVELGQGISAALIQTLCTELGFKASQVRLAAGDTQLTPDEGYTSGSQSVEVGVKALKHACSVVRDRYIDAACRELKCSPQDLELKGGCFRLIANSASAAGVGAGAGTPVTANALSFFQISQRCPLSTILLNEPNPIRHDLRPRQVEEVFRADFLDKFTGAGFIQDLTLADLWHAKIVRGPHPFSKPLSYNLKELEALEGVDRVFIQHHFIALIGRYEELLSIALASARGAIVWSDPNISPEQDIEKLLTHLPCTTSVALELGASSEHAVSSQHAGLPQDTELSKSVGQAQMLHLTARYSRPYIAHASIGLVCALAQPSVCNTSLTVWSHSQGVFKLRDQIAESLGLSNEQVRVIHAPGAGCYGHNAADDVAFDAALISHKLGINVRVAWTREDELSQSPVGAASLVQLDADILADGSLASWNTQVWSNTHLSRPGWGEGIQLLGAWSAFEEQKQPLAVDVPLPTGGGLRNAVPAYSVGKLKITHHFIESAPVRVSALRSLGAHANVFAIESFIDELADLISVDPVALRLMNLRDERAKGVIKRVAEMCSWSKRGEPGSSVGTGLGYSRYKNHAGYCAVAVQVEVMHKVRVQKVWACVDAGLVVHKDGLINQIEGGIIQSLSWTLKENVQWDKNSVLTTDWEKYPILEFDEVPAIEIELIENIEDPSLGAGEVATGPTAGALSNAIAHALGLRIRHMPFTFDNVSKAIDAS